MNTGAGNKYQLISILVYLAAGAGMGFVYDFIGLFRRNTDRVLGILFDFIFCVLVAFVSFFLYMKYGNGVTDIWAEALMLTAFLTYIYLVRPTISPLWDALSGTGRIVFKKFKNIFNKVQLLLKNLFKKVQ